MFFDIKHTHNDNEMSLCIITILHLVLSYKLFHPCSLVSAYNDIMLTTMLFVVLCAVTSGRIHF